MGRPLKLAFLYILPVIILFSLNWIASLIRILERRSFSITRFDAETLLAIIVLFLINFLTFSLAYRRKSIALLIPLVVFLPSLYDLVAITIPGLAGITMCVSGVKRAWLNCEIDGLIILPIGFGLVGMVLSGGYYLFVYSKVKSVLKG